MGGMCLVEQPSVLDPAVFKFPLAHYVRRYLAFQESIVDGPV